MAEQTMTDAQANVLAVLEKTGAAALGLRTDVRRNVVHAGAAKALARSGRLELFLGHDGNSWARRVEDAR